MDCSNLNHARTVAGQEARTAVSNLLKMYPGIAAAVEHDQERCGTVTADDLRTIAVENGAKGTILYNQFEDAIAAAAELQRIDDEHHRLPAEFHHHACSHLNSY